jgi:RNA polymerase sigma-70 factor (ECF subfamily)
VFDEQVAVTRIRIGDIKAYEQVFRLYYAPLCAYATCIVGDSDESEEIVQQLFYVLWRDHDRLSVFRSLKSYLYASVRNDALRHLEHEEVKRRHQESVLSLQPAEAAPEADAQQQLEYAELQQLVADVLLTLPPRCGVVYRMLREEGKKYAEIADRLHLSVKTVEADVTKTLKALRREVEHYIKSSI